MIAKVSLFICSIVCIALFLASCTTSSQNEKTEEQINFSTGSSLLDKTIEAHGGIQQWRQFQTMTFTKSSENNPQNEQHLVDLNKRNTLILSSSFRMGYDGENVWVTPGLDKSPSQNPRFYHNLWFYFASIPFVFTDDGVNASDMEPVEIGGKPYNRIKVTFENEIGASPRDQYILYTHPKSHLLQMINYSVTFFDEAKGDQFNALVYNNFEEFQGLLLPTLLTGYTWSNQNLGQKRYETYLSDYKFSNEAPLQSLFAVPFKERKLFVDSLKVN